MKRLYLDTSTIGGYFDDEFKEWTVELFNQTIKGKYIFVFSDVSTRELEKAPEHVKNLMIDIVPNQNKEFISSDERSFTLATAYIGAAAKVI